MKNSYISIYIICVSTILMGCANNENRSDKITVKISLVDTTTYPRYLVRLDYTNNTHTDYFIPTFSWESITIYTEGMEVLPDRYDYIDTAQVLPMIRYNIPQSTYWNDFVRYDKEALLKEWEIYSIINNVDQSFDERSGYPYEFESHCRIKYSGGIPIRAGETATDYQMLDEYYYDDNGAFVADFEIGYKRGCARDYSFVDTIESNGVKLYTPYIDGILGYKIYRDEVEVLNKLEIKATEPKSIRSWMQP